MKTPFAFIILLITFSATHAQTPTFSRYDIAESGCQIHMPATPVFEVDYSEDSSEVYTGEVESGGLNYGVICVRFKEVVGENEEELTEVLIAYLDFLKVQFEIDDSTGYGKGQQLGERMDIVGMLDYWEDMDLQQYTIMGWINRDYLAVLMIYGDEEADVNVSKTFFQGMLFP